MQTEMETRKRRFFSGKPLSVFSKIAVATFVGLTILGFLMLSFSSMDQIATISGALLLSAGLILTRIRWMPLVGGLITALLLYVFIFKEPLPIYYLDHPKDSLSVASLSFLMFVRYVLLLWGMVIALGCCTLAFIRNYWWRKSSTPRWFTFAGGGLIGILLATILLGTLMPSPTPAIAAVGDGNQPLLIHMEHNVFMPSSVTIPISSSIVLLNDNNFSHTLSNGAWANGQAQTEKKTNAPAVVHISITIAGQSLEVGTFDTPGTYHLYDERNPGMTLTIIVH